MRPSIWRAIMLGIIALSFVFVFLDVTSAGHQTSPGYRGVSDAGFNRYRVTSVEPGGSAQAQGIVVGDVLSLTANTLAERVRWLQQRAGDRFGFTIDHVGKKRTAVLVVHEVPADFTGNIGYYVYVALRFIFLAMAFVLAWQRPREVAARTLATFLTAAGFALAPDPIWYPPAAVPLLFGVLNPLAWMVFIFQAAAFTTVFPRPLEHRLIMFFRRATPIVAALFIPYIVVAFYLVFVDERVLPLAKVAPPLFYAYCITVIAASLSTALRVARGADVQRTRWIAATIGVGLSGLIGFLILSLAGKYAPWLEFLPLTFAVIPLGLGYVILRHHLFDIRFVINRALVYGTMSSAVVGSFGIMEWLLGKVLNGTNHATSNIIEIGTALFIGTSLRSVHHKVDATIDDIFFRDRHLAETALLRFTAEAGYITEMNALLSRTIATIDANTKIVGSAVYVAGEHAAMSQAASSFPDIRSATIDENDPALVSMRAHRERVDLAAGHSALPGIVAFPMLVRGELIGALCCGVKASGDAFAPDEQHVLEQLTRAVALAIDALHTAELREQLRTLVGSDWTLEELRARLPLGRPGTATF